jgi:hypothetical protein
MSDPYSFDPSTENDDAMGSPPSLAAGGAPTLTPGASDDAPFRKEMEDMRKRALQQSERLGGQAEQQIGQNSEIARQKAAALKPLREQQLAAASQPLPQPPPTQPLPPVPSNEMSDADNAWLNAAMFLGSLAGGLTRNHVTNALAGMTGAVEGYTKGRQDLFHQQMDIWKAANDRALKENERSQKAYAQVLQNRQLSMEQKMMQVQITAAQFDDEAMAGAAAQKDTIAVAQLADQRARYATDMGKASTALDEQRMVQARQEVARMGDQIQAIAEYRQAPPQQRSGYEGMVSRALMDAVQQYSLNTLGRPYSAAEWNKVNRGAGAQGAAEGRLPAAAALRQMGGFGPVDFRQVAFQNAAIDHLDTLRTYSAALANNDINTINEIKQRIQQELGFDPPTNFDAAKQIVGNEVIRAITTTGGGVYDRQEISGVLNRARSPQQLVGIIDVYQRLIAAQTLSRQRQYEVSRAGIPNAPPFEGLLSERVKRLLSKDQGFTVTDATPQNAEQLVRTWRREADQQLSQIVPPDRTELHNDINSTAKSANDAAMSAIGTAGHAVADAARWTGNEIQREFGDLRDVYNDPSKLLETPDWLRNMLPEGWVVTDRWVKKKPGMQGDMPIPPEK